VAPGTRDTLIDVAAGLLDEGGVGAVTLREVGRLAGVSHNAPYKHFANKEALLAAIAARELESQAAALTAAARERSPVAVLRAAMHRYLNWALEHPARFKLTFGAWSEGSDELAAAANAAQTVMIGMVATSQEAGVLPPGDPVRLASLLRALAHGAADLASTGHLRADGKGNADAGQLIDDLFAYLRSAASSGPPTRTGGRTRRAR
jgi:AcrR family transcriptional regulator